MISTAVQAHDQLDSVWQYVLDDRGRSAYGCPQSITGERLFAYMSAKFLLIPIRPPSGHLDEREEGCYAQHVFWVLKRCVCAVYSQPLPACPAPETAMYKR